MGTPIPIGVYIWLVEGASKNVLIDTGCSAENPHPIQAGWFAEVPQDRLQIVDGEEEVLEGIRVVHTPGHTPGGQSVLIETENGTIGLCGLCTIRENLYPPEELRQMGMRVITPGIHTNAMQAHDSLIKLLELSDQVIALHDASYKSVGRIPQGS